ncbi:hypothetical protein HID58_042506, partial [Brassica napus]
CIHKSIKYNVWSSTSNGNKKLNAAYNEAAGDKSSCPVFLIFSVNTSGQFVGLAEMVKIEQGVKQSFTASDKKATPKDKSKETSVIAEVAEEISQNGVAEVASTC